MNAQQLETLIRQVQSRVDLRSNYITTLESTYSYEIPSGNSPKLRHYPEYVQRTVKNQRQVQYEDKKVLKALYELQRLRAEVKSSRMDG